AGGAIDQVGLLRQVMWMRGPRAAVQRLHRFLWPTSYDQRGRVLSNWGIRMRRLRAGLLSLRAPDER
ncbi:MAG: hypothetical protein JWM95_215, partial [Gemmatimonadetes bacterium]|nr:hypothetical protein [Gemmatimonadota bacterium]